MNYEDNLGNIAWSHVLNSNYRDAIEIYHELVKGTPGRAVWNNYGTALMMAGEASAAEAAFRQVRGFSEYSCSVTMRVGAAIWVQGRQEDACSDWLQELDRILASNVLKRQCPMSMLFLCQLWWASKRLDNPEMWKSLQPQIKAARKLKGQRLDRADEIYSCIAGELSPDRYLDIAVQRCFAGTAPTSRRELSDLSGAYFYASSHFAPFSDQWNSCIQKSVEYGRQAAWFDAEYHIARYELARIQQHGGRGQ